MLERRETEQHSVKNSEYEAMNKTSRIKLHSIKKEAFLDLTAFIRHRLNLQHSVKNAEYEAVNMTSRIELHSILKEAFLD